MTRDGGTRTQPKVSDTLMLLSFNSMHGFAKVIMIILSLTIILPSVEKERTVLRPAKSMDSLSSVPYPHEGASPYCLPSLYLIV